ncbi:hypothetical protein AOLI_G00223530 [Acnodon oligacanthus]
MGRRTAWPPALLPWRRRQADLRAWRKLQEINTSLQLQLIKSSCLEEFQRGTPARWRARAPRAALSSKNENTNKASELPSRAPTAAALRRRRERRTCLSAEGERKADAATTPTRGLPPAPRRRETRGGKARNAACSRSSRPRYVHAL